MAGLRNSLKRFRTLNMHSIPHDEPSAQFRNTRRAIIPTVNATRQEFSSKCMTRQLSSGTRCSLACPTDFDVKLSSRRTSPSRSLFVAPVRLCSTRDGPECWKCHKQIDRIKEQFFCECGVIQAPRERTYFEMMGIEEVYNIDVDSLQKRFIDLQRSLHPDKYSTKSKEEQEFSQQQSTLVNQAYRTLQKPYTRGLYLLQLNGQGIDEGQIEMDPAFLANIMELNEQLAEAPSDEFLKQLKQQMSLTISDLNSKISNAFKEQDFPGAKQLLAQIKYYVNIEEKVTELLEPSQSTN